MTNDPMSVLQALDKEYGISNVPDNVYHVTLGDNSKAYEGKEGKNDSFRFGWKVRCGEYTGRELGDFARWFPTNKAKEGDKDAIRAARGTTIQMVKAIALSMSPEDQARLNQAVIGLRDSADSVEANGYFGQIASIARGLDLYVRAKTTPAKDPQTGQIDQTKDGFQNVRYLDKGQPIHAICTCVTDAVTV